MPFASGSYATFCMVYAEQNFTFYQKYDHHALAKHVLAGSLFSVPSGAPACGRYLLGYPSNCTGCQAVPSLQSTQLVQALQS